MGLGSAGTREIADAASDRATVNVEIARRALFWSTLILAVAGALTTWLFRRQIAMRVMQDGRWSAGIGWLALGVALTVGSVSQTSLLTGLRHISSVAWLTVASSVASTILGIAAIMALGRSGLPAFVVATPLASFLLGLLLVSRLPRGAVMRPSFRDVAGQIQNLARLGFPIMLAGLASPLAQLCVRTTIQRQLGLNALGYFQASWTVSMTYLGFVLGAMGTDFYPRLAGTIGDPHEANRLVNDQTEVALLLSGPVFLALLGLTPSVMKLLYTEALAPAAVVLRWQVLGDVLKVASWPLGFMLLAAGRGLRFLAAETLAYAVFAGLSFVGLRWFGVQATGMAFVAMYAVYLPLVGVLARRQTSFAWRRSVKLLFLGLAVSAVVVFALAGYSGIAAGCVGCGSAAVFGTFAIRQLYRSTSHTDTPGEISAATARRFAR